MEDLRELVVKASVLGQDIQQPTSVPDEENDNFSAILNKERVIAPPYDPALLLRLWENSGLLNPNVESYMTNIESLGHRLEPMFDFDAQGVKDQIREAMWAEEGDLDVPFPDDPAVDKVLEGLRVRSQMEKVRFNCFIESVNPEGSFVTLRRTTRQDLEITGNAYWEVLRNKKGQIARFVHVPSLHMRLTRASSEPTEVTDRAPVGLTGWDKVKQFRFFRRFAQIINNRSTDNPFTWFKEFGDPRVLNRRTGVFYADMKEFKAKAGPGDTPATEIIHFKLRRPGESYGVPRWIGNLLAIMGSRAADEVNYDYFDNKAIPPMALLVSGGRIGQDDVNKIEKYIHNNIRGRSNFHKILLIEAQPPETSQMAGQAVQPKLTFERLMDQQQGDALFQKYDERNMEKIGNSFRLPRLMRGDIRDFNRATAQAALRFVEDQVFQPERNEFDAAFNRRVLPELDIRLWKFRSNGHQTRDPDTVAEIAAKLVRNGVLKPNEARTLVSDVLPQDFEPVDEQWAKIPPQIFVASISAGEIVDEELDASATEEEMQQLQAEANRINQTQENARQQAKDNLAAAAAQKDPSNA